MPPVPQYLSVDKSMFDHTLPPTRTSQVIPHCDNFLSWWCEPVEQQLRQSGSWPTRRADSRGAQLFCRGFIWTRAMQLFTALVGNHHQGFYLCSPILWSVDAEETRKGGSKRNMARGPLMSCHCPPRLFLSPFPSFFCPVFLFLRVPGMPPIFLCSNYCLS